MSVADNAKGMLAGLDKRVFAIILGSLVFLLLFGSLVSRAYLDETRQSIHRNLDTVSRLKAEQIEGWLAERRGNASQFVASVSFVAAVLKAKKGDAQARVFIQERLNSLSRIYGYRQALVVLPDLSILAGAGSDAPELFHVDASVRQTFKSGNTQFVDLHLESVAGRKIAEIGVAAPLFSSDSPEEAAAVVYLSMDPHDALFPMVRSWPSSFATAETVLIRRDGDHVFFLTDLHRTGKPAMSHSVPLSNKDLMAARAVREGPGIYVGPDYAGHPVLAAARPVTGTRWLLVSKLDIAEAYAPLRKIERFSALVLASFVLLAGLSVWFWVRRERDSMALRERAALHERDRLLLRYSSMARFANDAILILDGNQAIIEANAPAEVMYGYSVAELIGMQIMDLRAPEFREAGRKMLDALEKGEHRRYESVHVRKDGGQFDVEISLSVTDEAGRRLYIGIVRDITDAKAQARRIERLGRLYQTLGEVNEVIVRSKDPDQLLTEVCGIAQRRAGFVAAFAGQIEPESGWLRRIAAPGISTDTLSMLRINARESEAEGRGTGGQALRTRRTVVCNDIPGAEYMRPWHEMARRDGIRAVAACPLVQGGKSWGLLSFYSSETDYFDAEYLQLLDRLAADISYFLDAYLGELQRRDAVAQMAEKEATLSLALRVTAQGLWDFDIRTGTAKVNSVYATMLGHDPETFVETPAGWRERMHPDDRDAADAALRAHIEGRAADYAVEFRMRALDGQWRWLRSIGQVIERDASGAPVRMLGTHIDVTEQKERELRLQQSEARLRLQFERMPVAFILVDAATLVVQEWNPAAERIFGFTRQEIFGHSPFGMFIPVDQEGYVRQQAQILRDTGKGGRMIAESRTRDGRSIQCRWSFNPLRDAGGTLTSIMAMAEDITESVISQERRRLWSEVMQKADEGIMICGPDERIISVNEAFTAITGYPAEEVIGQTPRLLKSGRHGVGFYEQLWSALKRSGVWRGEIWNKRKNGDIYPEWLTLTAVHDDEGVVRQYVALFSDITERKAAEERIRHMAHYDALTGLPNRVLLMDRLTQAVSAARRRGDRIGVVFMDLDRFKNINDSLGHDAGDELLKLTAGRMRAAVREGDTVARLSGDEFVLLLPPIREAEDAGAVAQKVLDAIKEPLELRGTPVTVSGSAGIAVFPENGDDPRELLRNADAALYRAKDQGGSVYEFYSREMNLHALESLALESSLRLAIERSELVLHYQPQVEAGSGRIIGLEALVRWKHPQLGLIPPGRFVPLAEERGLIGALGRWVLRAACAQVAAWRSAGILTVPVGVNVSAPQFRDTGFPVEISEVLKEYGMEAEMLELDLTESILMGDSDSTVERLRALRDMGLGLAVDDFGTGYSSLNYLRHFPVTRLKVDQSFVRDLEEDRNSANIVAGVISLAKSLGLTVIAEGVETRGQYAYLHEHGCDQLQGYLFSRPVPAPEVEPLLRAGRIDLPPAEERETS